MQNHNNQADKRIRILKALSLCLQEKPYDRTSIKEIAAAAGVNHGLIHYYFKSKEDLLIHYIDHVISHYHSIFLDWRKGKEKEGVEGKALIDALFDFMNDRITLNRQLSAVFIEIWEIGMYKPAVREKLQSAYMEWIRVLAGMLGHVMDDEKAARKISISIIAFLEGMSLFSVLMEAEAMDIEKTLTLVKSIIINQELSQHFTVNDKSPQNQGS